MSARKIKQSLQLVLVVVLGVLVQGDAERPAPAIVVFAPEHEVVHLSQTGEGDIVLRGPFGTRTLAEGGSLAVTVTGGATLELGSLSAGALELSAHRLAVVGHVSARRVRLSADELLYVDEAAELAAAEVELSARVVVNIGTVRTNSVRSEDRIAIDGEHVMNQGVLGAPGGEVRIAFGSHYLESRRGSIDVSGDENGGVIRIAGGEGSRLFSSGRHRALGRRGGRIALDASAVELAGASLDVSGAEGGGHIDVGGDTRRLAVRGGTLVADGTEAGSGGRIVLASLDATVFGGHASSRGGRLAGDGGFIDVSSAGDVALGGEIAIDAPMGHAGKLVLDPKNITIGEPQELFSIELVDPSPFAGDLFGAETASLATGNIVVTDAFDDFAASDAGAVHLYSGQDGALLATLIGSSADDNVGRGVTALVNGNYVVTSESWHNGGTADAGAASWGDGNAGIAGAVSAANSLVGTTTGDLVGVDGATALSNGNYVVTSPSWDNGGVVDAGAATWGNGSTGITGAVSAANSLVGTTANDSTSFGVRTLGNGNYVVTRPFWDNGAALDVGAATWGNGTSGVVGPVSAANSLVGATAGDNVGSYGMTELSNGNYVVMSPAWDNGGIVNAGAATWGDGATGIVGAVSAANSLVGTTADDYVGSGVRALVNGNYVVTSGAWDNGVVLNAGAATWGDGTTGIAGAVSTGNSLVGTSDFDQVGANGVTALSNGNYVVASTGWHYGVVATNAGAATWGDGTTGITGVVSAANSLVGTTSFDLVGWVVTALSNGNYVVTSPGWHNGGAVDAGSATWGDGTTGITGAVSAANSLVGTSSGDFVNHRVTALANGNYVVSSRSWHNGGVVNAGAATWGDGTTGITGAVSATNSLVGTTTNDFVGLVTALSNGNYVVASAGWDNGGIANRGAATWGDGTTGITGPISDANSLVGTIAGDFVGSAGVTALSNGNYVVASEEWHNGGVAAAGAITWGDGTTGITGAVSAANSLVGTTANDYLGESGVTALSDGSYVVEIPKWDNGGAANVGALALGNGITGVSGVVSASNSVLGPLAGGGTDCSASEGAPTSFIGSFPNAGSVRLVVVNFETVQPSYGLLPSSSITVPPEAITSVLSQGADVVLEASNDLVVDAALLADNPDGDGGSLTLSAGRRIELNANVVTDGGDLTLIANDVLASGVVDAERDEGDGGIEWATGITVDTGGGALALLVRDGAGKTFSESGELQLGDATAGTLLAQVQGASLLLQGAVQATGAADAIVLVTDTAFAADTGSLDAPSGRFLVYAPSPEEVIPGGLVFSFEEYDKTYPDEPEPEHDGSGILYAAPDPGAGGGDAGGGGEGEGGGGTPATPPEDEGCGCRTAGGTPRSPLAALLLLLSVARVRASRRRSSLR